MRNIFSFLTVIFLLSCGGKEERSQTIDKPDTVNSTDTSEAQDEDETVLSPAPKAYANERFREMSVRKDGDNRFTISGKGQLFEASFGWVVEDGHNELTKGFASTDAGAPEWGNFEFSVEVQKQRPNSTLTLVLFETSAKDGSRQHELAIPLN